MRRRLSSLPPALGWVQREAPWVAQILWHHLPVALFLACAMSALGTDLLRDVDTLLMRGVYLFNLKLGSALGLAPTGQDAGADDRSLEISIISLTPAAFSNYLLRTSPAPRARLACVLYALSKALPDPADERRPPPVIGIDIDITPIESKSKPEAARGKSTESKSEAKAAPWEPTDDEKGCHAEFVNETKVRNPTVTAVVAWAIGHLTTKHCVVAIGFPHPGDTDSTERDKFVDSLRTRVHGPSQCGGVQFASPDLVEIPHEYVSEYAAGRLPFGRLPCKVRGELGIERYVHLPMESCSLGRVMGARLRYLHGLPGKSGCLAPEPSDVLEAIPPAAYRARRIHLGPAGAAIAYSSVVPGKRSFEGDLLADATQAFGASVQASDLFVVTADSGTVADQFVVPSLERPVPGAWVHAAVALTEFRATASNDDSHGHEAAEFGTHVGGDLAWASAFAVVNAVALRLVRLLANQVVREIAIALVPAAVLVAFVSVALQLDAVRFAAGEWQPHAPVLLGMALHTYVELTAHAEAPAAGTGRRQADAVRRCVQLLWAAALWSFVLMGVQPDLRSTPWTVVCMSLACGCAYLAAAVRWDFVPLPWRIACNAPNRTPARWLNPRARRL